MVMTAPKRRAPKPSALMTSPPSTRVSAFPPRVSAGLPILACYDYRAFPFGRATTFPAFSPRIAASIVLPMVSTARRSGSASRCA